MNITKNFIQETLKIKIQDAKTKEGIPYPKKEFDFEITKFGKDKLFKITEESAQITRNTTKVYSNYGQFGTLLHPQIGAMIIPMNCFKTITLLPFKLPTKYQEFLQLLVVYEETDFLAEKIFEEDKDEYMRKLFVPKNRIFMFSSIYHKTVFIKLILRVIFTLVFYCFKGQIEKTRDFDKGQNGSCCEKFFYIYLVKIILCLTFINLPTTLIYFCTSFHTKISITEFLFMMIDVIIIGYCLSKIKFVNDITKKKKIEDLRSYLEITLINSTMTYQNGEVIAEPIDWLINFSLISKILLIFSLQDYPKLCAILIFILGIISLGILVKKMSIRRDNKIYISSILLGIALIIETVIFTLLSLIPFFDILRSNKEFSLALIILSISWISFTLLLSIVLLFEGRRYNTQKLPKTTVDSFDFSVSEGSGKNSKKGLKPNGENEKNLESEHQILERNDSVKDKGRRINRKKHLLIGGSYFINRRNFVVPVRVSGIRSKKFIGGDGNEGVAKKIVFTRGKRFK